MRRLQRVLVFVNKPKKVSSSFAKFHSSILLQDQNRSENFNKLYQTVLELNSTAETYHAIEAYEDLKSKHLYELDVQHYTEIIDSFAPRKLMFGYFKHYKDFVDMYYDAGFVNASKRMQEARIVFDDISRSPLNLVPSLATYHALMKAQLSCGMGNVLQVFNTYNQLQTQPTLNATMTTYNTLLRACSLLERDDVAEEIFVFTLSKVAQHKKNNILTEEKATGSKNASRSPVITQSKPIPRTQEILNPANEVSMQFYNTMLDVYAESRNYYAFRFFDILLEKELPINAVTLNAYAKACIFMDFREKLSKLPELMRVRGILHRELSAPVRKEITDSYKYFTTPFNYKNKLYMKVASGHPLPQGEDPYDNLRTMPTWGREIDLRDYKFLNLIKPNLDKWQVNLDKISTPKDPNFYVTQQTQDENPAMNPVYNIPFQHML